MNFNDLQRGDVIQEALTGKLRTINSTVHIYDGEAFIFLEEDGTEDCITELHVRDIIGGEYKFVTRPVEIIVT